MICPTCLSDLPAGAACGWCARYGRSPLPLALAPGELLADQYRVGRVLGEPGGFGITYLAWDTRLETRVAIKEYLPRGLAARGDDRRRVVPSSPGEDQAFAHGLRGFLHEARALAKFDHPNIVRVRTFFEAHGTAYFVMNYYAGETLQDRTDRAGRPFSEAETLGYMLPLLDGLEAVHRKGMLHRDIKPANVYLAGGTLPILLDFGAARTAVGERSRNLTEILTDGYAPLEQYSSRGNQGPWTDLYACGATMFYLVTGSTPPVATDRVMGDALPPLARLRRDLSPPFCDAVDRALAMRPEQRPRSVAELRALLAGADTGRRRGSGETEESDATGAALILECGHCGAANRVPAGRAPGSASCGRCGRRMLGHTAPGRSPVALCPRCSSKNRLPEGAMSRLAAREPLRCGRCDGPLLQRAGR